MKTVKIIRHRHRIEHYVNDTIIEVEQEIHYKILFSDPSEQQAWQEWLIENKGSYKWDKEENSVTDDSVLPKLEELPEDTCWCDVFTHYVLNVAGYAFHSFMTPYKGELYVKD